MASCANVAAPLALMLIELLPGAKTGKFKLCNAGKPFLKAFPLASATIAVILAESTESVSPLANGPMTLKAMPFVLIAIAPPEPPGAVPFIL
jgi:hypothetical protein